MIERHILLAPLPEHLLLSLTEFWQGNSSSADLNQADRQLKVNCGNRYGLID
jgi:hypothetical protein